MPSQTRTKAAVRGAKVKSKSGRRPPVNVRVKTGSDLPILPIAVGVVLAVLAIGLIVYGYINSKPASAAGVPCDQGEQNKVHYHVALQIVYQGNLTPIPGGIGITGGEAAPTCLYWLHVHSANQDVIHVESPTNQTFTVGQFFQVWDAWSVAQGGPSERLDSKHVSTFALTSDQKLVVYVDAGDGKGAQLYTGDPKKIVLAKHEVITLEITPPTVNPPPAFSWTTGSNVGL